MATQVQILALVRSYSERDDARFQSLALQMASEAAQRGNRKLADQIRVMIQDSRDRQQKVVELRGGPIPVVRPKGELAGLVSASYPTTRLDSMVLDAAVMERLEGVIEEQRCRAKLAEHGLRPRRKFLLTGPPGTGKTLGSGPIDYGLVR